MVAAWYMNNVDSDQKESHKTDPPVMVEIGDLHKIGVEYCKLIDSSDDYEQQLIDYMDKYGYSYRDEIRVSRDQLPNYDDKIKSFYREHLHTDDEVRFVRDGSGYFDVRDRQDKWIRIFVERGDLIVLPAGIYHRFTTDASNYICAVRLFVGEPVWTPYDRPADDNAARQVYRQKFAIAA